jgi:hypothetical protein
MSVDRAEGVGVTVLTGGVLALAEDDEVDKGRVANSNRDSAAKTSPVLFQPPFFGSMKGQTGRH